MNSNNLIILAAVGAGGYLLYTQQQQKKVRTVNDQIRAGASKVLDTVLGPSKPSKPTKGAGGTASGGSEWNLGGTGIAVSVNGKDLFNGLKNVLGFGSSEPKPKGTGGPIDAEVNPGNLTPGTLGKIDANSGENTPLDTGPYFAPGGPPLSEAPFYQPGGAPGPSDTTAPVTTPTFTPPVYEDSNTGLDFAGYDFA